MKNLLKNKFILGLMTLLGLFIIISGVLQIITPSDLDTIPPKPSYTQSNIDNSKSALNNIVYVGPSFTPTETLGVYQVNQISQNSLETAVNSIVSNYSLKQSQHKPNRYVSLNHFLEINESQKKLYLNARNQENNKLKNNIDYSTALSVAKKFLNKNFSDQNFTPIEDSILYLSGNYQLLEVSPAEAEYIEIPFSYQLESFAVYLNKQSQPPIKILVNNQQEVQKAEIATDLFDFQLIQDQNLLTIDQALANINQRNLGSIIVYQQDIGQDLLLSEINSGELDLVEVEYRLDKQNQLAYPTYRFSGDLVDKNNNRFSAQIITPAIEVEQELQ